MKRYILAGCSLCLLIVWLSSCNDDAKNVFPTGILYLNVEEDATMLTKAKNEVTYESLQVVILQGEEDAQDTVKVFNDYLTEVKSQRLILPIGKYTVAVRSNGADEAGWETPLYMGQEEVEVKQGEITNAKVTCTIANAKVSVVYDDDIRKRFADYQVTVSNSSGSLKYTRDEYRSGFFIPEKLTTKLDLVNHDGNKFTIKNVYPDIQPKYHYTFIYTISNKPDEGEEAGADFDIKVEKENDEIIYSIFIKEESLVGTGEPSFTLSDVFMAEGVYPFKKTGDNLKPSPNTVCLDYMMGSKNEIQSVKVAVNSPSFPNQKTFDITKGEGALIGFPALPGEGVSSNDDRVTIHRLDLSSMVEKLDCFDNQPTDHKFTVYLIDDKYQEAAIDFTIRIMPDIDAYVDVPICWTTFAVLKGVCLDKTSYFKLQIGSDETNIKDIEVQRGEEGKISALVTGLKVGETYKYWIVSKEDENLKCTPKEFEMKSFIEVPNLGFENWSERKKSAVAFGQGGTFMTPNAANTNIYWDSGNWGASAAEKTLTNSTNENATDNSVKAASLKSQFASKMGIGAFAAGSVFAGEAQSVSSSGAILKYGQEHNGYPTCLRGYYKYTPGKINYTDSRKPAGVKEGDTDQCFIYIALGTKQLDVVSTTSEIKVFNKEREGIFAYGEYITSKTEDRTGESSTGNILNGYAPFKIPLIYTANPPKDGKVYIFIVATASRYGDYFTGSTSSVLYVDEFSLDYDYDAASFVGTELKDMTPININD